jgi:hypothetical protein
MKKITIIFITSLFILNLPATLLAAQKTITAFTWDRNIQVVAGGGNPLIPPGGPDFPPVVNDPTNPAITIDPVTHAILLGNAVGNGSGAIWYGGTTTGCNPCTSGVCTFGLGFRAYFEFKINTTDSSTDSRAVGDGFNFTIVNASNNDVTKRGGFPNTSGSMGELMGYAGSGNTATTSSLPRATAPLDGLGLEPPKMDLEFDTYPNTGAMVNNGCSGNRNDTTNNHIALLFWGANTAPVLTTMCPTGSTAGTTFPQASYDDNIHGAGTAGSPSDNPINSAYNDGTGGYYERAKGTSTYNWLENAQYHRVRIEVIRIPSTYSYQMKAWVDCESLASPYTGCPANEYVYFQDVINPYNNSSYLPKIDRTQILTSAFNTLFNNILFGFTLGTGGATQGIEINNFAIYFPTSSINPTSGSHTYSAATGQTVTVTTASATCTWRAVSNNTDWLTVTSPISGTGTGPGNVTYSITANNTGAQRTGTITIGGQTFTVDQAAGPPTCTLTASANIVPYNGTTNLSWSVSGAATTATWTTSPLGTCGSPNPAGGTCTTGTQTTAGLRTYTLTVTNANGSSTCSTTFYVGCSGYQVWNQYGDRRYFKVTGSGCLRIRDGNEITTTTYRLNPSETVIRYSTSDSSCGSALGEINYTDAMNTDIVPNGGNGNCQVDYNVGDTVSDH